MIWKSIKNCKPNNSKKVWISYFLGGVFTNQHQTYAQIVGKDSNEDPIWHDFIAGGTMNNSKITVTHWMNTPDNPKMFLDN